MAKPKEERNRQFIADWKGKRITDKELMDKYGLSLESLKGLKARLRKKNPSLYVKPLTSKPAIQQADKLVKYNKTTYYLNPEMIKSI